MVLDESNRPVRPWLTVILDDKSRAVAGYKVLLTLVADAFDKGACIIAKIGVNKSKIAIQIPF